MSSQYQHENQAQRNERFFQSLDKTVSINREWIVTAAFYAALHWLEAYYDNQHGLHFDSHNTRNQMVRRSRLPLSIEYLELYEASRQARYFLHRFTRKEVENIINHLYKPIKDFIHNVLHPLPLSP